MAKRKKDWIPLVAKSGETVGFIKPRAGAVGFVRRMVGKHGSMVSKLEHGLVGLIGGHKKTFRKGK